VKTDIEAIHETGLLLPEDSKALSELTKELEHTFNTVQVHRTRTEMEVSVLNEIKHPTPASKYWQAVREQNGMAQGVAMMSFDYRKEKVNCAILERKIEAEVDHLEKELLCIELDRTRYVLKDMERAARAKVREIRDWSDIMKRESKNMQLVDLENVDSHQLISYTHRWIKQVLQMGSQGSPAENQNLIGQLKSGLARCEKAGVIFAVLADYDEELRVRLRALMEED